MPRCEEGLATTRTLVRPGGGATTNGLAMHQSPLLVRIGRTVAVAALATAGLVPTATTASATPVCTDGFMGGPPLDLCGGRVFPEAENTVDYIQYHPNPLTGFEEWRHGMAYLEQEHPRWIESFTLAERYDTDLAVSMGPDQTRSYEDGDTGDGRDIFVVRLTDHEVPDEGKQTLLFSLSVHGDEKGGLEGGARAIEDLIGWAEDGGTLTDGVAGYPSATGIEPEFHEYEVADLLANQIIYFIDFNTDGWAAGEPAGGGALYTRGNAGGTDLNRQMPTIGRIDGSRTPLQESEAFWGNQLMLEAAAEGVDGLLAYGADIHGEGQSRAFADIMYPAGQFDSVKHRQLMAIAERTKSVIDETLYEGLVNAIEEATGGDVGEGIEDFDPLVPSNTIPTKPARWGTVWDTLGYTDTGFIGDYLASQLGVTGMDYEIAFNHSDVRAYGRPWSILLQENYVNATRAIIFTAMAYAQYQDREFADFSIDPKGRVAYLDNAERTEGERYPTRFEAAQGLPPVRTTLAEDQFSVTNTRFFEDLGQYVQGGVTPVGPRAIAQDGSVLDAFDTLAMADTFEPLDAAGDYDRAAFVANLGAWVERGGNLVLTDRSLHLLADLGVVEAYYVRDITVYQPYANFTSTDHPMTTGLRGNARQLSEATLVGYGIGNDASPMSVVSTEAWEAAGGEVVGTTGPGSGASDDGTLTSVGQVAVGDGQIRIMGGGLPMPTVDAAEFPYGLRDYSLTYSGLYVMENSIVHDAPGLGAVAASTDATPVAPAPSSLPVTGAGASLAGLAAIGVARSLRRRRTSWMVRSPA